MSRCTPKQLTAYLAAMDRAALEKLAAQAFGILYGETDAQDRDYYTDEKALQSCADAVESLDAVLASAGITFANVKRFGRAPDAKFPAEYLLLRQSGSPCELVYLRAGVPETVIYAGGRIKTKEHLLWLRLQPRWRALPVFNVKKGGSVVRITFTDEAPAPAPHSGPSDSELLDDLFHAIAQMKRFGGPGGYDADDRARKVFDRVAERIT